MQTPGSLPRAETWPGAFRVNWIMSLPLWFHTALGMKPTYLTPVHAVPHGSMTPSPSGPLTVFLLTLLWLPWPLCYSSSTPSPSPPQDLCTSCARVQSTLCELLAPSDPSGKVQREEVTGLGIHVKLVVVRIRTQAFLTTLLTPLPPVIALNLVPRPVHCVAQ